MLHKSCVLPAEIHRKNF